MFVYLVFWVVVKKIWFVVGVLFNILQNTIRHSTMYAHCRGRCRYRPEDSLECCFSDAYLNYSSSEACQPVDPRFPPPLSPVIGVMVPSRSLCLEESNWLTDCFPVTELEPWDADMGTWEKLSGILMQKLIIDLCHEQISV